MIPHITAQLSPGTTTIEPVQWSPGATTSEPTGHSHRSLHALEPVFQNQGGGRNVACTLQLESSPGSPQLEKEPTSHRGPAEPETNTESVKKGTLEDEGSCKLRARGAATKTPAGRRSPSHPSLMRHLLPGCHIFIPLVTENGFQRTEEETLPQHTSFGSLKV